MKFYKKKSFIISISIILFIALSVGIWNYYSDTYRYFLPEVQKEDISSLLLKENLTSKDYEILFYQTGLGKDAIDDMIKEKRTDDILKLNKIIFNKRDYKKEYIAYPVTYAERCKESVPMAPLKDGDILISLNTKTLCYRHGHCAIVTNAKTGEILEHASLGNTSSFSYASEFSRYPGFAILRYNDEDIAKKASRYAKESLYDIDYSIFAGLITKDKSKNGRVDTSHCSHIVWQAYKKFGVDIDKDGGKIVTPYDVLHDDNLKVVQVFGMKYSDFLNS